MNKSLPGSRGQSTDSSQYLCAEFHFDNSVILIFKATAYSHYAH